MDINGFFYQLDQYYEAKETAKAEAYMKACLSEAETGGDFSAAVAICNELGGYYRAISRYEEGIVLYEKALSYIRLLNAENSEAHGTTLINYATACTMTGEKEKALSFYQQAAAIFSGPAYVTDYRLATLYNNMSLLCQDLEKTKEAEEYLEKALYILNCLEESQIETAVTYTNLSLVFLSQNRLDEAKASIKKALDIFIKESGGSDVHYSAAVCVLGEIYYKEEQFEKAAALFQKAMDLSERDYGSDTLNYALLCENLAQCEEKLMRPEASSAHRNLALSIRERLSQ